MVESQEVSWFIEMSLSIINCDREVRVELV